MLLVLGTTPWNSSSERSELSMLFPVRSLLLRRPQVVLMWVNAPSYCVCPLQVAMSWWVNWHPLAACGWPQGNTWRAWSSLCSSKHRGPGAPPPILQVQQGCPGRCWPPPTERPASAQWSCQVIKLNIMAWGGQSSPGREREAPLRLLTPVKSDGGTDVMGWQIQVLNMFGQKSSLQAGTHPHHLLPQLSFAPDH